MSDIPEFDTMRPRLMALLELHRAAQTEEARLALVDIFDKMFLEATWHVAQDLLEHGWAPGFVSTAAAAHARLRVVGGTDAA
jgi:hypothetical protein